MKSVSDSARGGMRKVAVCIATCGRPSDLDRLLGSIARLKLEKHPDVEVSVIIVDNHPEGQGREIAADWVGRMPFRLRYDTESKPGVSSARNRLVRMAKGCECVAFIDDDETAREDWLDELLEAQGIFSADVVQGAMRCRYENPPAWLEQGRFFEMKPYLHGQPLSEAYTFNVLVSVDALSWVDGPFDERLNLSGGEDVFLFRQLYLKGAKIVFTDRAVTEETRPRSRTTLKWYCRRAFRIGNTNVIIDRYLNRSLGGVLKWSGYAVGRFGQGAMLFCKALVCGRTTAIRGILALCLGAGNVTGLFNYRFHEYRRQ